MHLDNINYAKHLFQKYRRNICYTILIFFSSISFGANHVISQQNAEIPRLNFPSSCGSIDPGISPLPEQQTCSVKTENLGCEVSAPVFGSDSCDRTHILCLDSNFIACGYNIHVKSNTRFGSMSGYPIQVPPNCLAFSSTAQQANAIGGGQWIWADITVNGYRNTAQFDEQRKAQICAKTNDGTGRSYRPPNTRCIIPIGQNSGTLFCDGSPCGICYSRDN